MTPAEYRAATEHREAVSLRVLSRLVPEQLAWERVQRGTARFLPDGPETAGHQLLTADNEAGQAARSRSSPLACHFVSAISQWVPVPGGTSRTVP